jgi:hypothetical protein
MAKKASAPKKVVATGTKKKVDLAPGVSPWEKKAIKKGQTKLTHAQKRLHEEFVKGKRDSRRILGEGGYIDAPTMARMKMNLMSTNKKNRRTIDGSLSANATSAAYALGRGIQDNKIANGRMGRQDNLNYIKTLKKNTLKQIDNGAKKYYKKKGNK